MKPRPFKEMNKILIAPRGAHADGIFMDGPLDYHTGKSVREIGDLPVFRDGQQIISCWKLNPWDRIKALCFGRVWLGIWGKTTQPPVRLDCCRTIFSRQPKPKGLANVTRGKEIP